MPTRKEFCQCCLAALLAGCFARAPLVFGRRGDEVKKENGEKIIGACGIVCSECPAYIATQNDDDALRAKTAEEWSTMFHADIKAENVNCDGCPGDGPRLFAHCLECEIRACARGKKVSTCAACPDYSCEKLEAFLAQVPEARKTLEELRKRK